MMSLTKRLSPIDCRPNGARGFALIISLALMSFIFLLIISLSTLLRLESQVSATQVEMTRAQQNALLGLHTALGQLQSLAGPDQRVTATANIDGSLAEPTHAHWTGVWDASGRDPYGVYAEPDELGWLVSGVDNSGNALEPGATVEDAVMIVGENSVAVADDQVEVGKVSVDAAGDGSDDSGHYAYWISDEGVKAKLNLTDVHRDASSGDATEQRYSLMSAQRNGIESISAQESDADKKLSDVIDPLDNEVQDSLLRMTSLNQLGLLDTSLDEVRKYRFHDVTTHGFGLLTNTASGGLKKDLTLAFEMDLDDFNDVGVFAADGETVPNLTGHRVNYLFSFDDFNDPAPTVDDPLARGPTWHLLRNFYRLYKTDDPDRYQSYKIGNLNGVVPSGSGYTIAARPYFPTRAVSTINSAGVDCIATGYYYSSSDPVVRAQYSGSNGNDIDLGRETDMPITPIVLRERLFMSLIVTDVTPASSGGGSEDETETKKQYQVDLKISPVVTLWNPYNVRLSFDELQVRLINVTLNCVITVEGTEYKLDDIFNNKSIFLQLTASGGGSTTLEPGEIQLYAMSNNATFADANLSATCYPYSGSMASLKGVLFDTLDNPDSLVVEEDEALSLSGGAGSYMSSYMWLGYQGNAGKVYSLFQCGRVNVEDNLIWPSDGSTVYLADLDDNGLLTSPLNVGALDLYSKPVSDSNPVQFLTHYNPRATQASRATGVLGVESKGEGGLNPGNLGFEFYSIESSNTTALALPGYWGNDNASGETRVVLFEIPTLPMQSLAGFQHVNNVSHYSQNPAYPIGNSYANPFIGPEAVSRTISTVYSGSTKTWTQLDWSYLCNQALWDDYFFSTLVPRTDLDMDDEDWNTFVTGFANGTYTLADGRIKLLPDVIPSEFIATVLGNAASDSIDPDAYENVAADLVVDGAFNVNSTSVEAWKSLLSATNSLDMRYLNSSGSSQSTASSQDFPYSRMSLPNDTAEQDWTGFRSLTDDEIDDLATAIVEQVQERGPFVSLADFVNRRLSNDDTALKGALQAAIDETSINNAFNDTVSTSDLSGYNLPYADHATGDIASGATGYLRQSDLLQTLGPVLSARSDTFIIRAYGDNVNELTNVTTKAWCEAVVQRMPEYVDDSDAPTVSGTALNQINQDFGRRFRIVSFRWLSEDQI